VWRAEQPDSQSHKRSHIIGSQWVQTPRHGNPIIPSPIANHTGSAPTAWVCAAPHPRAIAHAQRQEHTPRDGGDAGARQRRVEQPARLLHQRVARRAVAHLRQTAVLLRRRGCSTAGTATHSSAPARIAPPAPARTPGLPRRCRRERPADPSTHTRTLSVWVRVIITGSQKCRNVGKSQTVLVLTNPMIFTRTRMRACVCVCVWCWRCLLAACVVAMCWLCRRCVW
jgi:hypothetical protein